MVNSVKNSSANKTENPCGHQYVRIQIESPGTEHDNLRTGYPTTIINPGDPPDIS